MPTNDIDYNCHIKAMHRTYLTNHMGSISHHITPLVINNLGGGHTHTHTHTNTHTNVRGQSNFKKPGTRLIKKEERLISLLQGNKSNILKCKKLINKVLSLSISGSAMLFHLNIAYPGHLYQKF